MNKATLASSYSFNVTARYAGVRYARDGHASARLLPASDGELRVFERWIQAKRGHTGQIVNLGFRATAAGNVLKLPCVRLYSVRRSSMRRLAHLVFHFADAEEAVELQALGTFYSHRPWFRIHVQLHPDDAQYGDPRLLRTAAMRYKRNSNWAALMCLSPPFQQFMGCPGNSEQTTTAMRDFLGVDSRKALDNQVAAAERFLWLRLYYARWLARMKHTLSDQPA